MTVRKILSHPKKDVGMTGTNKIAQNYIFFLTSTSNN